MKTSGHLLHTFSQTKIENGLAASIFALLFCSLLLAGDASAQTSIYTQQAETASGQKEARGKSTVRGRVVYDDTSRPLRRVRVMIYDPSSTNNRHQRMAWTDGNGEFILKHVVAGKYYVIVDAPGIIRQEVFEHGDDLSEIATASVNGTNSAEVKIRVRRGGVISGKVTYADGEPAIKATLSILRKKEGRITPVYLSEDCGNGVQTDERGMYRVSGLSPGEYFVGAAEQKMSEAGQGDEEGATIQSALLALTYYDGSTSIRSASPVQVDAGNETNNVNITLVERSTHKISGTLAMRGNDHPVTQAMITLNSKDEPDGSSSYLETRSASPDAQGQWSFDEVVDGTYTITVAPARDHDGYTLGTAGSRVNSGGAPQPFIVKRQDVTMVGSDVTGLVIEVSKGGSVSGTVTVEGGRPLPPTLTISPETANGDRRIQLSSPARVHPDGTFTVDGMPSDGVWIRAVSWPDKSYYTKSVTVGGVDLMNEPLMVKDGSEVRGVRIVISPDVATLTGRVLIAEGGAPVRGASVILVPAELHKLRILSARLYGYTNAEGGFTIKGAPGDYMALILRPGTDPYTLGDEGIKARMATAQRITLQSNERKNMDLIAPAIK